MADWDVCYNWVLDNEDAARAYAIVPDAPPGAHAISGINSAAYPLQFAKISALPPDQRGVEVENFYQAAFWNKWYAQLASDELAKRVFDVAVNMGPGTAVKLLQNAAGCAADGCWGPATLAAVNAMGDFLVVPFKTARLAHYQAIVKRNPALAHYLGTAANPGPWWARAIK